MQFLAGLAEFVAALLLLWRRTAWLGGLIGFIDLAVVWLLNMTFDVPVKIPSAFQELPYLLMLARWLPRLFRFVAGRATEAVEAPQVITSDKAHRVTHFFPTVVAVVAIGAGGFAMFTGITKALDRDGTEHSGLYAVSGGDIDAAPALSDDQRWAAIAFGSIDGSQLVWAAYKNASGGGLDSGERLAYDPYQPAVYPLDTLRSHNTTVFN